MVIYYMAYYKSKIMKYGEFAEEFFDAGVMVFFGQQAPEELQEYSIIHEHRSQPTEELRPGDIITINNKPIKVLAVGSVANENFKNLGHLVIKFNDSDTVEMEGDVNVSKQPLPTPAPDSYLTVGRE